jgi:hypothetical protein
MSKVLGIPANKIKCIAALRLPAARRFERSYSWHHWRILLFLITCSWFIAGCSRVADEVPPITRWVDPDKIESVVTEHQQILEGRYFLNFDNLSPFITLDEKAKWYPFYPPTELTGFSKDTESTDLEVERLGSGRGIKLGKTTGVALLIPLDVPGARKKRSRIFIECKYGSGATAPGSALIFQLSARPVLADPYRPGLLKEAIKELILATQPLGESEDRGSASRIISLNDDTRSILFVYAPMEGKECCLEWVKLGHMTRVHEALVCHQTKRSSHPAIDYNPLISGMVRPSFFMPPKTVITLKEMTMPPGARFHCALGMISGACPPVKFMIRRRERGGEQHDIINHLLTGDEDGWVEFDCDLSRLSGNTIQFTLHCDWAEEGMEKSGIPPLVYCGSPAIITPEFNTPVPDYNLILISLDALRRDHLGCYGYSRPVSPEIDRFANKNILFKNVYSHAPYTLPAHGSLFTSLYPSVHGLESWEHSLSLNLDLMAEILARNGVATASFNGGGMFHIPSAFIKDSTSTARWIPSVNTIPAWVRFFKISWQTELAVHFPSLWIGSAT